MEVSGKTWDVCFHFRLNPVTDTPNVKTNKIHELEEESHFWGYQLNETFSFQKKITRHKKKQESMVLSKEQNKSMQNISEDASVRLTRQRFFFFRQRFLRHLS